MSNHQFKKSFKGIALFTPGGDLFYCIDPTKQTRWHLHLCIALQEILSLKEPPHFLVPGYTATVDRWLMSSTGEIKTTAAIYPAVRLYQSLLNVIFNLPQELVWEIAHWEEESCNPMVIEVYQQQFPELWQNHELVVRIDSDNHLQKTLNSQLTTSEGYNLILFISDYNLPSPETLQTIHRILEDGLNQPYTFKIINITKHPEQAEQFQISATPTLVRTRPKPIRRIIGEFENWERVLQILTS